jgi:hypothetical protein
MHERAMEEQGIAGAHPDRLKLLSLGDRHVDVGKAQAGVSLAREARR